MIRTIAAIDKNRGLAKNGQIPWNLPNDKHRFRDLTLNYGANVLMGYRTYLSMGSYLLKRHNFIVSHNNLKLPKDSILVSNLEDFLKSFKNDLWIIGGQSIYEQTIDLTDELYLTIIEANFKCDQLFPEYNQFMLVNKEGPFIENNLVYSYQTFRRL